MVTDFLLDPATGDLLIRDGDLVLDAADEQHLEHVLLAQPGHWRQSPLTGVGIGDFLDEDSGAGSLRAVIEQQVVQDGARINALRVGAAGQIDLDAVYDA